MKPLNILSCSDDRKMTCIEAVGMINVVFLLCFSLQLIMLNECDKALNKCNVSFILNNSTF